MSFEELPHTADVKIRARAPDLPGLFSEAFRALMEVMFGQDRKGVTERDVTVKAEDTETLLADFLSEVLFVSDAEGLVFARADVDLKDGQLTARLYGEPFDPARHAGGSEVKGISYSGLSITRDTNGYMLDILFDV